MIGQKPVDPFSQNKMSKKNDKNSAEELVIEYLKKNKLFVTSYFLKKIPGIGDYISCSIPAILKDENCPVIDGNIKRILKRVFNLDENKKLFKTQISYIAKELTPISKNGIYNVSSRHSETLNNENNLIGMLVDDLSENILENLAAEINDL